MTPPDNAIEHAAANIPLAIPSQPYFSRVENVTTIQRAEESDWPQIWRLLEPVFHLGETYAYPPEITEAEARTLWIKVPQATYTAKDAAGEVIGTYYLKPNQPGPGSHVCNCGYVVSEGARGICGGLIPACEPHTFALQPVS
jgi:hypothetical protein